MSPDILETAARWGIARGFHGAGGSFREASPGVLEAILAAMGAEAPAPPPGDPVQFARPGPYEVPRGAAVHTEDGRELTGTARLELGYHALEIDGELRPLVCAPASCAEPGFARGFGLAAQAYSVLSARSAGIGDLADLGDLGEWAAARGAAFVLVNPLHAALPGHPQEASPYYPSSRRFLNPLFLRVEEAGPVPSTALIDRDAVLDAKIAALEARWERERAASAAEVDAFMCERPGLAGYAAFCALAELHGRPWRTWPEEVRRPGPAVDRFARDRADRVHFHAWLQLLLDRQLATAARRFGLLADMAVGVHPDGADAWAFQDVLAAGVAVGAPPDAFNTAGQDWGLPPFDPWRLRAAGYGPLIETLRASFRHAAGVRVDHVMGLFRLFWIPAGLTPGEGAYVRYPHREMLDIVALESARAGAYVVGEDLGTVEDRVRDELAGRRVLSYRLLWFEEGPPDRYPAGALAALTTHDLPTLAGVWSGSEPMPEVVDRLCALTGLARDAPAAEVAVAIHARLAGSPSRMVAATLEDLVLEAQRPNRPGTTDAANWSRPLPLTLEQLMADPTAARVLEALGSSGRR